MNDRVGALWIRKGKSGQKFLAGVIEIDGKEHRIVVFANTKKDKETHPDYNILLGRDRTEGPADGGADRVPF